MRNVTLEPDEILVSFDAEALYPSIPLKKCIDLIKQQLENKHTLSSRTPLSPTDTTHLLNLCLSSSDFIYNKTHHTASDSGPIGLSIMVIIAQIWMDCGSEWRGRRLAVDGPRARFESPVT